MELDVTDIKQQPQSRAEAPSAPQAYLRMVPRTGRTVYVKNNVDVARSFKLLAQQVAQNGVRRDFYLQRFHERPGKKRKRLRSQRWERRFKKGFKATISRGTPGFVELPSDLTTPVIVLGVDGSSRPGRTQKASSYRDVGVDAEFRSSSQPKVYRESGGRSMLSLPAKRWMKARSMSTGNGVALSGVGRRDRGLDKDAFPFDAYRRVRAFEERVSGLDQQLNIMQKIINETLTKRNRLETDIQAVSDKASRHRKGQTEPDTDDSKSREHRQNFRDREEGRKEVEHGPKILELQDQLKVIQTKIQSLSTEHAVQREHFKKVADDSPSEEWKTLASQTNKLLEQLDLMAQQVGSAILSYFGKYDEHLKTTASDHLNDLQRKLDGNMNSWNEEIQQRREFEEKLLKEYSSGISWYQREIQQLQGESLNKETALERLRIEFSNERQRLNDEHKEQLAAKIIEYSRLTEKQHRKQERLVNWHSKKADEKDEKWQQKLTSAQGEITRLLHMRVEEQVGFQKETQKAGEQIRILTSDLTQVKQELDAAEKLNRELEVLIGESKQKMTDDFQEDFQALREKVDGLDAKNKEYLEEIEQLSEAKKDLKEKSKTLKSEIRRHEQELTEYRKKAEEAPQGIQDLQKSHYTAIKQLEEELAREKTSSEEHNRQISAEREKLARLEQLTESLRMSKHEQTEQHCKALEENTHRWQNDIDKMRLEWQKELDQLHEQIREAKANVFLKDANIRTLEQEVQAVQQRIQNVTSELSQAKEAQQSTLRAQAELEISKQEAERNLSELRRDLKGADDEKKSLIKQVAEQEAKIQTIMRENESLERSLVDVKESEETKQRLASLVSRLEQTQKQLANCQLEIRQKDAQLEKLKVTLQQERSKREELGSTQKLDRQGQNRQIAELTAQLKAKSKQLKDVELSYNVRATEQNKLLIQKSKAIKMLETKLQEARQGKKEVQETMKKAMLKQESKLSLVFNEYQKLRKEIRVMCRIRPAAPGDGATLGYETTARRGR
ncbi:hypothetical protein NUW58_g9374 [Xylaria curta]|uniref:Uncharacterized protein n=1 Tax=Xylaria curta TaxID=42375 RepID=A0ACC1MY73_9PEZI|nr:hypothetical protein NUW58_g9374 [Xylaria curta]